MKNYQEKYLKYKKKYFFKKAGNGIETMTELNKNSRKILNRIKRIRSRYQTPDYQTPLERERENYQTPLERYRKNKKNDIDYLTDYNEHLRKALEKAKSIR